uniref:NERD domain-containing protein n=1 Tax=Opuntia streptacantha TaxID=393608 RepID=A0A7C9DIJ3_OPUST
MLIELLCGFVLYKAIRRLFRHDDGVDVVESYDFNTLFSVASRLEKLYRGKAYVGLRIPDADSASRQNIDLVLVANGEAVVISVKNLAGVVSVNSDGSWVCISEHKHKEEHHPNPVAEVMKQAAALEAYLQQRGMVIPEGFLSYKVITPNPKFRTLNPGNFPPEVMQYDQWVQLKPELKSVLSEWITGAFRIAKKEMKESMYQQLHFILSTAPIWDRLELKGSKCVLGEFIEFKGKHDDIQALQCIRRSKVGRVIVQKASMFCLAPTKLQVLYCHRDYRSAGAFAFEWKEVTVRSSTELLFQPQNSKKACKFKLSMVTSLTLSA